MIRSILNWLLRESSGCYYIANIQGHRRRIDVDPKEAWSLYFAMQRGEI